MTVVTPEEIVRLQKRAKRQRLEDRLHSDLIKLGVPEPVRQYRYHPHRRWRFDFAWPDHGLAVEVDGGTWSGGRHTRGAGYEKDSEKINAANLLGWTCLRYTSSMVKSGRAAREIAEALGGGDAGTAA